ncbi:MAG: mannose-1-phosphate guanylyltransferase [Treponema sp.]|nr:mannose-1-phosphate guanylyltransferase [Treponema sp.]
MFTDVIILAGGFGERLWPASRPDFPKQFLSINDGISFLQNALIRSLAMKPQGKIIIATRKGLEHQISVQCKDLAQKLGGEQETKILKDVLIVAEPVPKHTTAPIILCCHLLNKIACGVKHSVMVLTSDHIITPVENFVNDAKKAFDCASKNHFVTFGIRPTEPSTGYGYIQTEIADDDERTVLKINSFKEKPDAKTAQKYIESGNCWWNSGMFAFDCNFFIDELSKCTPEVAAAFKNVPSLKEPEISKLNDIHFISKWDAMVQSYEATPAIAIDISVAEKTSEAWTVLASFSWDDVGSWDSFEKHSCGEGKCVNISANNNFVYSDIPVAICGLDDITVVIKNGKALIMKKGKSALVREVVKKIED